MRRGRGVHVGGSVGVSLIDENGVKRVGPGAGWRVACGIDPVIEGAVLGIRCSAGVGTDGVEVGKMVFVLHVRGFGGR